MRRQQKGAPYERAPEWIPSDRYAPGVGVASTCQSSAVFESTPLGTRLIDLPLPGAGTEGVNAMALLPKLVVSTSSPAGLSKCNSSPLLANPFPIAPERLMKFIVLVAKGTVVPATFAMTTNWPEGNW